MRKYFEKGQTHSTSCTSSPKHSPPSFYPRLPDGRRIGMKEMEALVRRVVERDYWSNYRARLGHKSNVSGLSTTLTFLLAALMIFLAPSSVSLMKSRSSTSKDLPPLRPRFGIGEVIGRWASMRLLGRRKRGLGKGSKLSGGTLNTNLSTALASCVSKIVVFVVAN